MSARLKIGAELDLRLLVGGVVRRSCSRSRRGRDGKGPLEHDRVDREHVNVIETKFGRAVRRCEGGLDVADNQQLVPLLEWTVSDPDRSATWPFLLAARAFLSFRFASCVFLPCFVVSLVSLGFHI